MYRYLLCFTFFEFVFAVVPDPTRFFTSYVDHLEPRNVTPLCLSDTTHWISQLRQGEPWALKMLDSWTKLPSGVLGGGRDQLGHFDECFDLTVQDNVTTFQGHYCRALSKVIIPGQPISPPSLQYAFCLPSTCSVEEIKSLLQLYVGPALGVGIAVLNLNPLDCFIKEPETSLPTDTILFIVFICVLSGVVVLSALLEYKLGEKTPALLRACSLTSTCRSLFNIRKHPADISCLHGIRIGSICWIILGHRYQQERLVPLTNRYVFTEIFNNPLSMSVANGMLGVDTFFFLSGLLICTSFMREISRGTIFDVIKFYVYRYLRLAIPIGVVILMYVTISKILGDGPTWNYYLITEAQHCYTSWWSTLTFVNNYFNIQCIGQTWYTSVDMQLAWLSPLVLLPLYHSPRAGLQLMTLLILISCFIPFTLTYIYHFPMSSMSVGIDIPMEGVPEGGDFRRQVYMPTHCRATPYLCGLIFGLHLFKTRSQTVKLSKKIIYLGWFLNTTLALTVVFTLSIAHQSDYVYNVVGSAFYAGFHRLAWSAVLMWIIFACVNKYGGLVDKILSWNMLLPISRLTYGAFLLHLVVIMYESSITRTITFYTDFDAVHDFLGDLIPVYFLSFILYVLIEGPIVALLRVAFSKGIQSPNKEHRTQLGEKRTSKEMKDTEQVK